MGTSSKYSNFWRSCAPSKICIQLAVILLLLVNQFAEASRNDTSADDNIPTPAVEYNEGPVIENISIPSCRKLEDTVCLKPECVHTANMVFNSMKPELDPCVDFYQYACGKFIAETQIKDGMSTSDTMGIVDNIMQERLQHILSEERSVTDPKHFKLPHHLYKACMNTTLIESLGAQPMSEISDSLGGWPVVMGNSWDSNNTWSWQENFKKLIRIGFEVDQLFNLFVLKDLLNNTRHMLMLGEPNLGLNRKYLLRGFNESRVSAYYEYMVDIAVLFGAEKQAAEKELNQSLKFEMDLAKMTLSQEEYRNLSIIINYKTMREVHQSYPYLQGKDFINDLLLRRVFVDEDEVINVLNPKYFKSLGGLLQNTSPRVIANYIMWRIHALSVPFLTEKFRQRKFKYYSSTIGISGETPRSDECIQAVVSSPLHISLASLYIRKYFSQESKGLAMEMVHNVRNAFAQILDQIKWMDEDTKRKAQSKLLAMTTHIGYPDEMLDNDELQKLYSAVEIDSAKYFKSVLNLAAFHIGNGISKLRLPVNKTSWINLQNPTEVNAYYSSFTNSIQFPAAILQSIFFHPERPKYMNYGAIGYIFGHEITHGFDDMGRQFDQDGNVVNWWHPATEKAFLNKTKCIIEQYSNFTDKQTGLQINGFNTQGENIADNGGIKLSYLAYNNWLATNIEELRLPGLQSYTPRQMFWISSAQIWCAKYRTEKLKNFITTNYHSPQHFRILGSFMNNEDFSRDFNCPKGTPMNPEKKCRIW